MESSGKGAAFFSSRWEGRLGLQEATGACEATPAAQVRRHAEELLRSVDPLTPACAGNRLHRAHQSGPSTAIASALMVRPGTAVCNL